MRLKLTALLVALAGVLLLSRPVQAGDLTPTSPFKVLVTASTNRVQLKKPFTLHLMVKNVSHATQEFETLTCSWWVNWTLDSAYLQFPTWDCDFHPPYKIILRPGGFWTNDVDIKLGKSIPVDHITLRAGFSPAVVNPNRDKNPTYIWSNEVKLEVVK